MLYLIGGAPRCGKTTVARQLAQVLCCSRVPTDYLGTAFTNYIPETELAQRYPPWNTATVDERYARYTIAEIVANYRTKAATVWPGLRDFLAYALYDRHEMVIEGYHLEPAFIYELRTTFPQFPLTAVFLYRTQYDRLQADLQQSSCPQDWVLRSATDPVTFSRIAAMICVYSNFILAEANTYGLPTLTMDHGMDQPFEQRSAEVAAYIQQMARAG
jgi:2-phosphoglycerate kinase